MEWSNEHWQLVVTPRYVRKDNQKVKVTCISCDGHGFDYDPDSMGSGDKGRPCIWCMGTGKREVLPEIPPPPEMDQKFLKDLKEWVENYRG